MKLIHKRCGGNVVEHNCKIYRMREVSYPWYFCEKCGDEIVGDEQTELVDNNEEI